MKHLALPFLLPWVALAAAPPAVPRVEHVVIHRQAGVYSAFPVLYQLPDEFRTLHAHFGAGVTSSHGEPRREPMNFTSTDGSGRPGDNGYPLSAELADGALVSVYYITRDGITGVEATRWPNPWKARQRP